MDAQQIREEIQAIRDEISVTAKAIRCSEDKLEQIGEALKELSDKRSEFNGLAAMRRSVISDMSNIPHAGVSTLRAAVGLDQVISGRDFARADESWDNTISSVESSRQDTEDEIASLNDRSRMLYTRLAELEQELAIAEVANAGLVL